MTALNRAGRIAHSIEQQWQWSNDIGTRFFQGHDRLHKRPLDVAAISRRPPPEAFVQFLRLTL